MSINVADYLKTVAVSDGAWGTLLDARGVPPGHCREEWNVSHPDVVESVAAEYVEAGSHIILTNTFTGNRFILAKHGLRDRAAEFSQAGAQISKRAAGTEARVFGSIGPSGKMVMMDEVSEDDLYEAFKEQAVALAAGGADAIVCETMTELAEIFAAIRAVKDSTDLPVVASMTFDSGPDQTRTVMGVAAQQAAAKLTEAGADIVGCNCGVGLDNYLKVARILRDNTDRPIWVKANAGLPELEGGQVVYKETPGQFASKVPALIKAGANIIGGCCGTNPEFVRAIRAVIDAA